MDLARTNLHVRRATFRWAPKPFSQTNSPLIGKSSWQRDGTMMSTLSPGTLVVRSAYPDPPFDLMQDGLRTGFDVDLMRAVCRELGLELQPVAYSGDDFNGIFNGLLDRSCDAVISGTTITPERASVVVFSKPYLEFNQGVAVNRHLSPNVTSPADLRGLTAGIQIGNTSDAVAKRLLTQGEIASIRYYPYHGIPAALDDLSAGRIGMIIKLFPVISWLVKDRPELTVAMQVPTHEKLGIAFARDSADLRDAVDAAIQKLHANGEFGRLQSRWFGRAEIM
ncbi:MAG: ABC transporter substrate-binding protein [Candidatus Cybelea sp.]